MALLDQITNLSQKGNYTPGPELLGFNQSRLRSIMSMLEATGGKGQANYVGERPDLFTPGADEKNILAQMMSLSRPDSSTPETSQLQNLVNFLRTAYNRPESAGETVSPYETQGLDALDKARSVSPYETQGLEDLRRTTETSGYDTSALDGLRRLTRPTPYDTSSLETLKGLTDVDEMTNAYEKYFDQIAGPQIKNNLTLGGQSGGGAWGEMVDRYMTQVGPQIESARREGVGIYGGAQQGLADRLRGAQTNLSSAEMNLSDRLRANLKDLGVARLGVGGTLRNADTNFGASSLNLGNTLSNRWLQQGQQGLGAQQLAGNFLNTIPTMKSISMNNLGLGLGAAGLERTGKLTNYLSDAGTVNQAFNAIPITNYGATRGDTTKTTEANGARWLSALSGGIPQITGLLNGLFGSNGALGSNGLIGAGINAGKSIFDLGKSLFNGDDSFTPVNPSDFPNMVDVAPDVTDTVSSFDWGDFL